MSVWVQKSVAECNWRWPFFNTVIRTEDSNAQLWTRRLFSWVEKHADKGHALQWTAVIILSTPVCNETKASLEFILSFCASSNKTAKCLLIKNAQLLYSAYTYYKKDEIDIWMTKIELSGFPVGLWSVLGLKLGSWVRACPVRVYEVIYR